MTIGFTIYVGDYSSREQASLQGDICKLSIRRLGNMYYNYIHSYKCYHLLKLEKKNTKF